MTLQGRLDAFTAEVMTGGKIPERVAAELIDGIREQIAGGQADRALKAGEAAPTFALKDADGVTVSSAKLLSRGPLVVSFFRGAWCQYCNLELQALEAARPEVDARGASLVAISMQNAENSRKSAQLNGVKFPILLDPGGIVAGNYGLRYSLKPRWIELYKSLGNDLEAVNSDDSWSLPIPGRYVIGQDGVIAYAEVNPDFTQRSEPDDLFPVLGQLARSRAV
jgi:peroxiredoxin